MPAGHTIQTMKEIAIKQNGLCLSQVYYNIYTKLKWKCQLGHTWETKPKYILNGSWCPICKDTKLKIEFFKNYAERKGGKCHSTKYLNIRSKLEFSCKDRHYFEMSGEQIRKNQWCMKCSILEKSLGIKEFQKIAQSRGGKCLSTKYKNGHDKLKWICKEGHTWEARANAIKRGVWCPQCHVYYYEELCRTTFEQLFNAKFPKSKPPWLINSRGNKMELDGFNKNLQLAFEYNGEQHYKTLKFHKGKIDLERRKKDDSLKRKLCKENKIKLITITYKDNIKELPNLLEKKLKNLFEINYKIDINFNKVFEHKSKLDELKSIAANKGGVCLSDKYINVNTHLTWQCSNGHVWKAIPKTIKNGHWCMKCHLNKSKR